MASFLKRLFGRQLDAGPDDSTAMPHAEQVGMNFDKIKTEYVPQDDGEGEGMDDGLVVIASPEPEDALAPGDPLNVNLEESAVDPNALVQQVMRDSYLKTEEDLPADAEKENFFEQQREATRDQLPGVRERMSPPDAFDKAAPEQVEGDSGPLSPGMDFGKEAPLGDMVEKKLPGDETAGTDFLKSESDVFPKLDPGFKKLGEDGPGGGDYLKAEGEASPLSLQYEKVDDTQPSPTQAAQGQEFPPSQQPDDLKQGDGQGQPDGGQGQPQPQADGQEDALPSVQEDGPSEYLKDLPAVMQDDEPSTMMSFKIEMDDNAGLVDSGPDLDDMPDIDLDDMDIDDAVGPPC